MPYRTHDAGKLVLLLLTAASYLPGAGGRIEFNRDVRPIFSDKCYTCHGPDAAAKHVPFRLDSESAAKAELSGGKHAIVAGDPEHERTHPPGDGRTTWATHAAGLVGAQVERR